MGMPNRAANPPRAEMFLPLLDPDAWEAMSPKGIPKIFISYRRKDSQAMTDRIFDHLTSRFSRDNVLRDIDSIPRGVDFHRWLIDAVENCDVLLAIIGPNWLDSKNANGERRLDDPSDFVRIEIETALTNNIPIIPVLLPEASMPAHKDLPESLRELSSRNASTVRHDPDFTSDIGRLVADAFSIAQTEQ